MAVNYQVDESGDLKKMVLRVMRDHKKLRVITNLRFLFTWRLGDPEYDSKEGSVIIASVRKLPTRERDIYGKDAELRFNLDAWQRMSDKQRYRAVFHELLHVTVELDEHINIVGDEDGRVKFTLASHDVLIRTFKEELELYGLPDEYVHTLDILTRKHQPAQEEMA